MSSDDDSFETPSLKIISLSDKIEEKQKDIEESIENEDYFCIENLMNIYIYSSLLIEEEESFSERKKERILEKLQELFSLIYNPFDFED